MDRAECDLCWFSFKELSQPAPRASVSSRWIRRGMQVASASYRGPLIFRMLQKVAMTISGHKTTSMISRYNIVDERDLPDAAKKLAKYLNGKTWWAVQDSNLR